jgi:hypothetical protein
VAEDCPLPIESIGPGISPEIRSLGRRFLVAMDLSEECIDDYASLTSDVGEYVFENGRRYHGYKSGRV